ncbi:hypothetical protein D1872_38050 [compost metagenome]
MRYVITRHKGMTRRERRILRRVSRDVGKKVTCVGYTNERGLIIKRDLSSASFEERTMFNRFMVLNINSSYGKSRNNLHRDK